MWNGNFCIISRIVKEVFISLTGAKYLHEVLCKFQHILPLKHLQVSCYWYSWFFAFKYLFNNTFYDFLIGQVVEFIGQSVYLLIAGIFFSTSYSYILFVFSWTISFAAWSFYCVKISLHLNKIKSFSAIKLSTAQ